jgi:hypothetical protein
MTTLTPTPKQQFLDANGNPLSGGKVYTYAAGTTTPLVTYTDESGTTPNSNPVILDSRGEAAIWLGVASYKLKLTTSTDVEIWTVDNIVSASVQALADLSESGGAALVGFIQTGTGVTATTVQAKLRESYDAINDFGADNTGATNTTAALLAFYNACIATGKSGKIRAGTYKVTPGVLVFDNGFTDKTWPEILTDGYTAVTFQIDPASTADAAVLTWRNGTATSGSGKYWRGGSHGGITILENRVGYLNTHGLSLTGTYAIKFGFMNSRNIGGALIYLPTNLYSSTNPDPYASAFTYFEGLQTNTGGYCLLNQNWLGMTHWIIDKIYSVNMLLGSVQGLGSECRINILVSASCKGWALDDGAQTATTGGTPHNNFVGTAEIDNNEYGIRLNKTYNNRLMQLRMIHRYQTSPNTTAKYWPLKAIDLAGGTTPSVVNNYIMMRHRVEGGGTTSDLGVFATGNNNANIANTTIEQDYTDEGSIGITDSMLYTSFSRNGSAKISVRSKQVYNSMDMAISFGRGSNATSVPNSGYASISSKINFPTQVYNTPSTSSLYNTSTSTFTAPRAGLYFVNVSLPLAVAIGTRVRLGVMANAAIALTKIMYSVNAGTVSYDLTGAVFLNAGEALYVTADQNTGGSVSCSPSFGNDEVRFVVNEIGY